MEGGETRFNKAREKTYTVITFSWIDRKEGKSAEPLTILYNAVFSINGIKMTSHLLL